MQFIQSASIFRLALTRATLCCLDMFAVHTGWAGLGIAQNPRRISVGVCRQFGALTVGLAVLTKIEPYPVRERLRYSTLEEVAGIRIFL